MKVFLVERNLEGITLHGLAAAKDAANGQAESMRREGSRIRYLRSTFVPGDGRCMCLFAADCVVVVRRLNDEAGLPYFAIVPCYDLTPEEIYGVQA